MAKITIDRDALNRALSIISPGIPSKATVPAAGVYKFDIKENKCHIYISNFAMEMSIYVKCESDEDVMFCTPHYIIENTVKNFPEGNIQITTERNEDDTFTKSIQLKPEGKRKKYKVACEPYENDFPHWPEEESPVEVCRFTTNMKDLQEQIKLVGSNVDPSDPTQVYQNISMVNNEGKIKFVSGNAHLAVGIDTSNETNQDAVLPAEVNKALSQLTESGEAQVVITQDRIEITYPGFSAKLKMVQSKAPPYMKLFNLEPETGVRVDRNELLATLRRMIGLSMENSRIVLECGSEALKVEAINKSFGHEAEEILEIENAQAFRVIMKCKYLMRAFTSSKSESMLIKVIGDGSTHKPVFIIPEDESMGLKWMISPMAT